MISKMIDSYQRDINYLRVSVTKRCNLNCSYCGAKNEASEELTPAQLEKIVRAFARNGITKVRLTGGEPLVRQDIVEIAQRLAGIDGIKKLAVTTNGIFLKRYAAELKRAGVTAVNISLDTTDREQFRSITGYDGLDKVFEGIDECERAGLSPIRLNAVLTKGKNEDQAESLISIARNRKIDVRFIELMPFSSDGEKDELVVTGEELLKKFPELKPFVKENATDFEKSVARYYTAEGFKGRVGFITPVSNSFCSECNRIRLLSDGKIKPCLGNSEVYDIKAFLDDEERLEQEIKKIILSKPREHSFGCGYGNHHGLNLIGG
ncbi:MAG: GTP 3',8-cyclase MoaA [Ruminococcaceae bacterium]|nr:GTP 3',8-cyclase MoaA [Oscillospiraceae bacterium]